MRWRGISYVLLGENTAYELVFTVPPDRSGSFQVAANGDVLLATGIWDNVVVATSAPISYNTTVPQLVDYDIPENYTPGEGFDVLLLYQTKSTLAAYPARRSYL